MNDFGALMTGSSAALDEADNPPGSTPDSLACIGYEAAYPCLQAPLWLEAVQATSATRSLR